MPADFLSNFSWRRIAQITVGLFFAAAAYFKVADSFFSDVSMHSVFEWWLRQNWPAPGYRQFMELIMPHPGIATALGILVIAGQALAGLCLIYNYRVRFAAVVLSFIQLNIFLATYNHPRFNIFVGTSLWIAVYYCCQGTLPEDGGLACRDKAVFLQRIFTYALVFLGLLAVRDRYLAGDPWLASVGWQREHFASEVMSVTPVIKHWFLALTAGQTGALLWTSVWWIHLALVILLLTRYRLYAGAALLTLWLTREAIWLNALTSEGVLWILLYFVWVTQEEAWQRTHAAVSLLPDWQTLKKARRFTLEKK